MNTHIRIKIQKAIAKLAVLFMFLGILINIIGLYDYKTKKDDIMFFFHIIIIIILSISIGKNMYLYGLRRALIYRNKVKSEYTIKVYDDFTVKVKLKTHPQDIDDKLKQTITENIENAKKDYLRLKYKGLITFADEEVK